jgi:hypothetical protein
MEKRDATHANQRWEKGLRQIRPSEQPGGNNILMVLRRIFFIRKELFPCETKKPEKFSPPALVKCKVLFYPAIREL